MKNTNEQHFFRNNVFNILFLVIIVLQFIPFGLFMMMGSQKAIIWLIPIILFIVLLSKRKNPILSFNTDHLLYQAAALGAPIKVEYKHINNIERTRDTFKITIENQKRPLAISLVNFNKADRENVANELEERFKQIQQ